MDCEEVDGFIDVYLDGELPIGRRLALEQHLALCSSCQSLVEEHHEFRTFFADTALRDKAPPQLKAKVLAAVRRGRAKQKPSLFWQPWVYATAVVALSVSLALKILFPDTEKEFSQQAVVRHSQSLSTQHLVDVASPDPAVVKSWLTARLSFTPPVAGAPASGYSLLGGRVDFIHNRSVATLVYKHDKGIVTLFCWPAKKEYLSNSDRSIEGYRVSTWSNAQCNYILVSKLSDRAMNEFVDSFRAPVQSHAYF